MALQADALAEKIYTIRGWKTMIDLEVAELILDLSNPQLNYGFCF